MATKKINAFDNLSEDILKQHLKNSSENELHKPSKKKDKLYKPLKDIIQEHLKNSSVNELHKPSKKVDIVHKHLKNSELINFDKIVGDCVKNKDFGKFNNLSTSDLKQLEEDYDNSFGDIKKFRNGFTSVDTTNIDTIIFHDENNDGLISCAIARHYLKENGKTNIKLISTKPGKFIPDQFINNRNILIVDLSFTKDVLQGYKRNANSLIIIDDHPETFKDEFIFNGTKHAACAYTWKFFYPRLEVPKVIQYIDDSDAKLFLKYIPKTHSHLFNHGIGFRYGHNKAPEIMIKKKNGELFDELWYIINNTEPNFWTTAGYYYNEVTENLKEQIAINAVVRDFQGYKVGILNFNAPALVKPVCRQIISNFRNQGKHIDFALLFGYEFTSNSWKCQLLDDHRQTAINMGEIASKLGREGGHPKGGKGHDHVGNFYWPRSRSQDIWDLFDM